MMMSSVTENGSTSSTVGSPTSVTDRQEQPEVVAMEFLPKQQERRCPQKSDDLWIAPASSKSMRTINPIRAIVDPIVANVKQGWQRQDGKDPISLALGDPTVSHNLPPCTPAMTAVTHALLSSNHAAGYANACGIPDARAAIAKYHSYPEHTIHPENVIIANGCSGALELALTALLDPGTILLVPQPGFPLYQVIAESHGATVVHYRLDSDKLWECDMDHLEELMARYNGTQDAANHHRPIVRGIVINNPSNPTGSVFSEHHLCQIVDFALKHRLPIVSDEVYGDLTFGNNIFHPLAQVAAKRGRRVPIITASGLAKQFLLPGWRVGWITFHDNIYGTLRGVEEGANRLAQVVLGACHLVQTAIPVLLSSKTPGMLEWKQQLRNTLERQAIHLCDKLSYCPGLSVSSAQGAMYAIVKIDMDKLNPQDIQSDVDFCRKLLEEENVFCLPGSAFGVPNVFRVVFCAPEPLLDIAANRIAAFCHRHYVHPV